MKVIDLSHNLVNGMQIYPGDPVVNIYDALTHDNDYCQVSNLHIGSHSGTHIDAPLHFIKGGKTITEYPVSYFIGEGTVIDVSNKLENEEITSSDLVDHMEELKEKDFAIIMTGWSKYFGSKKYENHPYLSKSAAEFLKEMKVRIVAVDFLNVDSTVLEIWETHPILLSEDILIVENLNNLEELDPSKDYFFSMAPLKLEGVDGSPIRAMAIEKKEEYYV